MYRAPFGAFAATDTFFTVDDSGIVDNTNRIVFAHFLAFAATNTTHLARGACFGAFVVVGTTHHSAMRTVVHNNQFFGTSGGTFGTTAAQCSIDTCQTVFDGDGAVFTSRSTIAVAQATIGTQTVTAEKLGCRATRLDAVIIQFAGGKFLATTAVYHGGLAYHIARSAQQFSGGFGNCRTTR